MAGFVAAESVEELTYDFNPHSPAKGTIPEPSSEQIEVYRNVTFGAVKELGLEPADLASGKVSFDAVFEVMDKASALEKTTIEATSALTQIPVADIEALPYRVQRAFLGWIMGTFFDPEA